MNDGTPKLRIRGKLFLVTAGLILVSVLVAYFTAKSDIEADTMRRMRGDLLVRAQLVSAAAGAIPLTTSGTEWDDLADRLGRDGAIRVTLIRRDGLVVGDSMVPTTELSEVDNHAKRPEVQAALRGHSGQAQRYSATMGQEMIYAAVPLYRNGSLWGAARVAHGLEQVHSALSALRHALVISALLALAVTLLVTSLVVHFASRKVRSLTELAQKIASGDLHVRTRVTGSDEFADLGQALDRLAKNLSTTLGVLREERDRLSGILENMHEGVLFLDQEGRVALLNPMLREMLVLTGDELGKTLLEAIRHVELRELLDSARVDEQVEKEIAVTGIRPSRLMVRAMRLEGAQKGILAVFVDVTETRRLENIRREFVANVSHELRTPVTSIRSAGESLQLALGRPEMALKFVDIIDRNGARLQDLVEDLLDLSRIESKQYKLSFEPLELTPFLTQVLSLFSERASRAEVRLVTEFGSDVPKARADRRALEHVVSNLVDNAIKYGAQGKVVTISTHVWGDRVQIRVTDRGPGIPEKHVPRIFERFYRIDAGRSRELGGTGLGLSIVKNLTESMGGSARVESREGHGTTFIISLTIAREPSSPV